MNALIQDVRFAFRPLRRTPAETNASGFASTTDRKTALRRGPADPLTFSCVPIAPIRVTVFASYLPARRAAKTDPMLALRYE
jgi:hypothetical protein